MEPKIEQVEIKDEDIKEEDFTPEILEAEDTDWKAKALELKGIAKRRATQLGKVKTKLTDLEGKIKELTSEPKPQDKKVEKKSDDIDYAQEAFLIANGVKEADEIELARGIAVDTGKSLKEVIGQSYFQFQLKELREAKAVKNALPSSSGRSATSARDSVEYWIAKGELPPADQVELCRKVVNAKIAKAKNVKHFTDNPFG